jgi:hypothetical protein
MNCSSSAVKVLRAGLEHLLHHVVLALAGGGDVDLPLPVEHERDRVARAEVAAELRELEPHLGDGARRVVGERLDHEGDAAGTVRFVEHLGVVDALELARALEDGALDVLLGAGLGLRVLDRGPQARVAVRVAAAGLGRHGDLAEELREHGAALLVSGGLVVLDLLPLGVAGHWTADGG